MLDKLILSDTENEHLTKSIACGVGLGVIIGAIFNNVELGFAFGGVVGVISSLVYSYHKRYKIKHKII